MKEGEIMNQYAMYLRKSRYDRDYEDSSLEETLSRHKKILDTLAKSQGLNVVAIYYEVVSGESISQRPDMQRLLEDVSNEMFDGVLVIDTDRLSRGNSIDQGIVLQTFKYSNTKIITPTKTYDPNDEIDEEYFEFSLFMSRKEYKMINKRLERGRKQSAKEGRFMGSIAPYGYERVKIKGDKGYTLKIYEPEAKYVRLMYQWYNHENLGSSKIANRLNSMGVKPRQAQEWSWPVVKTILNNCVNAGLIRCSRRKKIKTMVNGRLVIRQTNLHEYPIYEGLHEGIISRQEWEMVKETAKKNNRGNIPLNFDAELQNHYAGLIFCEKCGKFLTRVTAGRAEPRIHCRNKNCDCVSATFREVDETIYKALNKWLKKYKKEIECSKKQIFKTDYSAPVKEIDDEISTVNKQIEKCFTFLEQEVYTVEEFKKRKNALDEQVKELENKKQNLFNLSSQQDEIIKKKEQILPTAQTLVSDWHCLTSQQKNDLLRQVINKITYYKAPNAAPSEFTVNIFPLE